MIDTSVYKQKLSEELEIVTGELKSLGIHNPEVAEDWIATPEEASANEPDLNDTADRAESWAERRATLSLLETRYNNIKRALKKIEENSFGTCEVCGEPIETDRLDANPAARTCKTHLEEETSLTD